jgi:UrcA family protein
LRIRILLGFIGSLAIAGSTFAASPQLDPATGVLSVSVSRAGLDLTRADNARTMLIKLRRAASALCGEAPRPVELQRADDYRACMQATLDNAVNRLDAPVVAALYRANGTSAVAASGATR